MLSGPDGLITMVQDERTDRVLSAIVGAAGLNSTWAALESGKIVALANKETLVVAGPLVMDLARSRGGTILPVDSEHSAHFPGTPLRTRSRSAAGDPDLLGGTIPGPNPQQPLRGLRGGGDAPPYLEHGTENFGRLRHFNEQGGSKSSKQGGCSTSRSNRSRSSSIPNPSFIRWLSSWMEA